MYWSFIQGLIDNFSIFELLPLKNSIPKYLRWNSNDNIFEISPYIHVVPYHNFALFIQLHYKSKNHGTNCVHTSSNRTNCSNEFKKKISKFLFIFQWWTLHPLLWAPHHGMHHSESALYHYNVKNCYFLVAFWDFQSFSPNILNVKICTPPFKAPIFDLNPAMMI